MIFAVCIALLLALASASSGYLKLDLSIPQDLSEIAQHKVRFGLSSFSYYATLNVGSNKQPNTVFIDTGSSDFWVISSNANCTFGSSCNNSNSFNSGMSSSFHRQSSAPPFTSSLGSASLEGVYVKDTVGFGSLSVPNCTFAIANSTAYSFGILGLGLPQFQEGSLYSKEHNGTEDIYPSFPQRLVETGVISKPVFLLFMNDANASTGSLLFGAVDHAKYSGDLVTLPLVNPYPHVHSQPRAFSIMLSSLNVHGPKESVPIATEPIREILNNGRTFTYLPSDVLSDIATALGATLTESKKYEVECRNISSSFVDFNFSGTRIKVPVADLIYSEDSTCYLGLRASFDDALGNPYAILGMKFLRHAYVVYYLAELEISLAQVEFTSAEDIEAISSTIPSVVSVQGLPSTSVASESSTKNDFAATEKTPVAASTSPSTAGASASVVSHVSTTSPVATSTKVSSGIQGKVYLQTVYYVVLGFLSFVFV